VDRVRATAAGLPVYGLFLALYLAVAAAGSVASSYGLAVWYPALTKPAFNPPGWLFAPVWTVLSTS